MNELDFNQEWDYEWACGCWDNIDDDEIKDLIIDRNKDNNKSNSKDDILKYAVPTDEKYMKNVIDNLMEITLNL